MSSKVRPTSDDGAHSLPGWDLLRILAASGVIFAHSFPLLQVTDANEPFHRLAGINLGIYSVFFFFIISGFLITQSAMRSTDPATFAEKRLRRILPGFLVCNLLVFLVVCPWFANAGAVRFLTDPGSWGELFKTLTFQNRSLTFWDRVTFYPPIAPDDYLYFFANGVLWTIRIELVCYVMAGALVFLLRRRPLAAAGVGTALAFAPHLSNTLLGNEVIGDFSYLAPSFAAGMLLFALTTRHRAHGAVALGCVGLIALAIWLSADWPKTGPMVFPFLAAYPILWFGQRQWTVLPRLSAFGDPSYGIYLWGWPIQQVVRAAMGPSISPYLLAAISIPIAVMFGYASWHMLEKQMLRRKQPSGPVAAPQGELLGFNAARIIAAASVIFSHSYLIATRTEAGEPFKAATGWILGLYGVLIFFVISGYLVSLSAQRSHNAGDYLVRRVRRIMPGFWLCNILVVVLLCPLFALDGPRAFLLSSDTWKELASVLTFRSSSLWLPSVSFGEAVGPTDLVPQVANGVLWTIRQEFTWYLFVGVMLLLRVPALAAAGLAVIIAVLPTLFVNLQITEFVGSFAFSAPSFAAGMTLFALGHRHSARGSLALACLLPLVALAFGWNGWHQYGQLLFPALIAYPVLWFAQRGWPILHRISRLGDPSYGIYLWGWPIQITLFAVIQPNLSPTKLTLLSLPLALAFGYASWHLFERRFLGRSKSASLPDQRVGTGTSPR